MVDETTLAEVHWKQKVKEHWKWIILRQQVEEKEFSKGVWEERLREKEGRELCPGERGRRQTLQREWEAVSLSQASKEVQE